MTKIQQVTLAVHKDMSKDMTPKEHKSTKSRHLYTYAKVPGSVSHEDFLVESMKTIAQGRTKKKKRVKRIQLTTAGARFLLRYLVC